jgi:hypothetical protein
LLGGLLRFLSFWKGLEGLGVIDLPQKREPAARAQFPSRRFPQIPRQIAGIELYALRIRPDDPSDYPPAVASRSDPQGTQSDPIETDHFSSPRISELATTHPIPPMTKTK